MRGCLAIWNRQRGYCWTIWCLLHALLSPAHIWLQQSGVCIPPADSRLAGYSCKTAYSLFWHAGTRRILTQRTGRQQHVSAREAAAAKLALCRATACKCDPCSPRGVETLHYCSSLDKSCIPSWVSHTRQEAGLQPASCSTGPFGCSWQAGQQTICSAAACCRPQPADGWHEAAVSR